MDALAAYGSSSDEDEQQQQAFEKNDYKDDDNQKMNVVSTTILPPPPHLGSSNNNDDKDDDEWSMIGWNENYMSSLGYDIVTSSKCSIVSSRLQSLANNNNNNANTTGTSWASHFKSQHDFSNPAFLETLVQHFDLSYTMIPPQQQQRQKEGNKNDDIALFQDYEFDLIRLQQEAWARQASAEPIAQSTPEVQEKLQQAMHRHYQTK